MLAHCSAGDAFVYVTTSEHVLKLADNIILNFLSIYFASVAPWIRVSKIWCHIHSESYSHARARKVLFVRIWHQTYTRSHTPRDELRPKYKKRRNKMRLYLLFRNFYGLIYTQRRARRWLARRWCQTASHLVTFSLEYVRRHIIIVIVIMEPTEENKVK